MSNLAAISLNQGPDFTDLTGTLYCHKSLSSSQLIDRTVFLSAAGFASSAVLYNLADPSFLHDVYTVAPFDVSVPHTILLVD